MVATASAVTMSLAAFISVTNTPTGAARFRSSSRGVTVASVRKEVRARARAKSDAADASDAGRVASRIRVAYRRHVDYRREAALRIFVSFLVTFGLLRGLTYGIRYHVLPIQNVVTPGGLHIHHFVWGIFVLLLVGFLALVLDQPRWHPWLAIPFGIGAALVLDEFALWLNLEDVYWAKQGRTSVDVVIAFAALLGGYLAAERFWREALGEIREEVRSRLGR